MSGVVGYFNTLLLQIYRWVCRWKNFENRLTFGEVMGKSLVCCFFIDSRCSSIFSIWERRPTYISKTGENTGYRKYRSINHRSWTVGRVFDKSMSRRDYGRTFNDDFIRNCSRIGERIYKNRLHLVRLQSALTPRLHKATNYRFLSVQAALPCFLHVFQCSSITDI